MKLWIFVFFLLFNDWLQFFFNSAFLRHWISWPMQIVGPIQFWRSCQIFFAEGLCDFSPFCSSYFSDSLFLLLSPQLDAAPAPTSPPNKLRPNRVGGEGGGGSAGWWSLPLDSFLLLYAPNLFVFIKKVPRHILFFLLFQYITCLKVIKPCRSPDICQKWFYC